MTNYAMIFGWQGKEISLVCRAKGDMGHAVSGNIDKEMPPSRETHEWPGEALVLGQHPDGATAGRDFQTDFLGLYGGLFLVFLTGFPNFLGQP
ncbi:MAG: hypothetical protein LBP92_14655 [Deltaproteobacteria bacterium]|jgi:hypothetical protein|nr:hypothetical protein [Deltaproteobacteria bacterium]